MKHELKDLLGEGSLEHVKLPGYHFGIYTVLLLHIQYLLSTYLIGIDVLVQGIWYLFESRSIDTLQNSIKLMGIVIMITVKTYCSLLNLVKIIT